MSSRSFRQHVCPTAHFLYSLEFPLPTFSRICRSPRLLLPFSSIEFIHSPLSNYSKNESQNNNKSNLVISILILVYKHKSLRSCVPCHFLTGHSSEAASTFSIEMERSVCLLAVLVLAFYPLNRAAESNGLFDDNFSKSCPNTNFKTSEDGQIWYLSLDKQSGCGFMTKNRYRFGWFNMKLKLVGGDSAGVVTAYYMCSENAAGPERDELDIEFLGNRSGQPYLIQTNVYKNGTGGREMRHKLWFDPTEDFHDYSILWNDQQILFVVDRTPIRVYKNANYSNNFFPNEKPMYLFSSIWNADDWATRGGLEKTDWKKAPFVSSYKDFKVEACQWEDPFPACVSTTTANWWDQYNAWHLSDAQKKDYGWVQRNLVIYDYCKDTDRYPKLPEECWLSPWD